jgi:hypothetical protein
MSASVVEQNMFLQCQVFRTSMFSDEHRKISSSLLPTQSSAWKLGQIERRNSPPKGRLEMQAHKDHSRRVIVSIGVAATLVALLTAHHEKLVPPSPDAALRQAAVQDTPPPIQ